MECTVITDGKTQCFGQTNLFDFLHNIKYNLRQKSIPEQNKQKVQKHTLKIFLFTVFPDRKI